MPKRDRIIGADRIAAGLCTNGCDAPICPPSKVICRECIDRITQTLRDMLQRARAEEPSDAAQPGE